MAVVDDLAPGMDSSPPSEDYGRQPPQDLAAEQSVLGGMLLSKDAIADVLERLRPGDFYRPAHQNVYDAILDLYGRGEPADAVTVAAELDRRGLLRRIGGAPYLHTLISTVPTAANAGYYASIVAEKALLRRLVEAGTRVVQYGYAGAEGADVAEVVDRAQAEIYDVADRRLSEDFVALEDLLQPTMDEIDAIASSGGLARGVATGFTELDEVTNGLHPGQMVIVAARPGVGKSTLGLDFMRSCSIRHRMASVIFSLEMSKSEIVMRLLSAEAKIKLSDMRSGRMSDDDWTRLARRMSEISEAPLFIDDSPNLTMMEIRAKARRLRQKANLKLIVVDYLQLMTSGKKYESRQVEVSEFSRHLKLLAKELEVPVVAISQLNRGPEQRTDKKPMLADLRESGCLTASTRILRADTGAEVAFGELMRSGERPMVWSLDERLRMVARPMINVFPSGRKEVFRLRLASGREVEATGSHPFMKFEGWTPLAQLKVGDRIAAPRRVPEPIDTQRMPESELISLARMIGDGSCLKNQPIRYEPVDEANLAAVTVSAAHSDGAAIRDDYLAARVPSLRPARQRLPRGRCTPIAAWLAGLGLFTKRSHENAYRRLYFAPPMTRWRCFCGICGALVALFGGIPRMVKAGSTTAQPVGVSSTMWLNCCFGLGFFLDHTRPKVGRPRFVAAAHSWREGSGQVPSSRRRSRRRSGGGPRDAASAQRTGSQPEPGQRAEKSMGASPQPTVRQTDDGHPAPRTDDVEAFPEPVKAASRGGADRRSSDP